jgi:hypothetical protein
MTRREIVDAVRGDFWSARIRVTFDDRETQYDRHRID